MEQSSVNDNRCDPYKSFKFRIKWEGRYVAGVSRVGALRLSADIAQHRERGHLSPSHKPPGSTKYGPVTLERGVTHDVKFEQWANKVWDAGPDVSVADFRKDVVLDVFNEAGQKVLSYRLFRCWVSELQAIPGLDANSNAVAIETLRLENEGWECDLDVADPRVALERS